MEDRKGFIFNIQRYSLHDGKGIRTIVFFKGCPLACKWCANPESQSSKPEMMFTKSNCIGCGACQSQCKADALTAAGWNRELCLYCGKCADACPTGARRFAGRLMTVDEVVREAKKDMAFYHTSGGGVTFSGGEPLMQAGFAAALAKKLKSLYLDVAIETCGFAPWSAAQPVFEQVSQILYDIKIMDSEKHKFYTGVPNALILENARKCAKLGKKMTIRVPVIGGVNDDEENIKKTAAFARDIGVNEIHLLPYHRFGESKYEQLGFSYDFEGRTPDDEHMDRLLKLVGNAGLKAQIGG